MLFDILRDPDSFSMSYLIVSLLSALAVIFLTMPIHEFAHAYAATKLGDPTPKYMGRLSVNPFSHIDYFGALCIMLFGFGWAKPVEVNSRNFDNPKTGMAITAFAGPASNLMLAFVSVFVSAPIERIAYTLQSEFIWYISLFFYYIAVINVSLAVFNLIPVPPLDGSRLLGVILPDRIYFKIMRYERYLYYAVILLIITGVLDRPLSYLNSAIMYLINYIPNLIFF